MESLLGRLGST